MTSSFTCSSKMSLNLVAPFSKLVFQEQPPFLVPLQCVNLVLPAGLWLRFPTGPATRIFIPRFSVGHPILGPKLTNISKPPQVLSPFKTSFLSVNLELDDSLPTHSPLQLPNSTDFLMHSSLLILKGVLFSGNYNLVLLVLLCPWSPLFNF